MLNSNELINKVKNYNKFLNPEKLDKAYNFAVKAHKSQKRASGDLALPRSRADGGRRREPFTRKR